MENAEDWNITPNQKLLSGFPQTIRGVFDTIMASIDGRDHRPTISLALGDPSAFPSFHTTPIAVDAIISALRSANYNFYTPPVGILPARR